MYLNEKFSKIVYSAHAKWLLEHGFQSDPRTLHQPKKLVYFDCKARACYLLDVSDRHSDLIKFRSDLYLSDIDSAIN